MEDVRKRGAELGLSAYQDFLGARYNRYWRKVLVAAGPVEILFHLTEIPAADGLPASSIAPVIDGKTVRYRLCAGCRLELDASGIPWDWSRMKAWYDVDRLEIRPL